MSATAVLAMAYGTPASMADLKAYYTHIRRGREPSPERLAELRGRYEAIGGRSPLLEITEAQATGLAAALRGAGHDVEVVLGMKHSTPFIEDAARALVSAGIERVIGLVLAPHYSTMSIAQYGCRAAAALGADADGPAFELVESWATAPDYVALLADSVRDALGRLGPVAAADAEVVFTAHSLPERILAEGDRYPDELRATALAVAQAAGLARWSIAWQSAGRTADPWLGPDVLEVLPGIKAAGASGVVVCSAGFVADHLEVLYDLDIEAAGAARELGLPFTRTASPNADPGLIAALAAVVEPLLARAPARP